MIFPIYSKLFQNPSKAQLSSILKFSPHIELIKVDGILNKELLTRPTEWEKSNTSSDTSLASELEAFPGLTFLKMHFTC